jgi:hypothetical protein
MPRSTAGWPQWTRRPGPSHLPRTTLARSASCRHSVTPWTVTRLPEPQWEDGCLAAFLTFFSVPNLRLSRLGMFTTRRLMFTTRRLRHCSYVDAICFLLTYRTYNRSSLVDVIVYNDVVPFLLLPLIDKTLIFFPAPPFPYLFKKHQECVKVTK